MGWDWIGIGMVWYWHWGRWVEETSGNCVDGMDKLVTSYGCGTLVLGRRDSCGTGTRLFATPKSATSPFSVFAAILLFAGPKGIHGSLTRTLRLLCIAMSPQKPLYSAICILPSF